MTRSRLIAAGIRCKTFWMQGDWQRRIRAASQTCTHCPAMSTQWRGAMDADRRRKIAQHLRDAHQITA